MKKIVLVTALVAGASSANAAFTVTQNNAIGPARTAFGGSTVLDWNAAGAPGGVIAASGSSIAIGQWINGTGFEGLDLAISGNESFTWNFASAVSRIGFAVSTGKGIFPSEVRDTGAVFKLLTSGGDTGTLTLAAGPGFTTWVEINSSTPFTSISFTDTTDIWDQYFGNVLAASGVPEPATWGMMILGFGGTAGTMRYKRRRTTASYA